MHVPEVLRAFKERGLPETSLLESVPAMAPGLRLVWNYYSEGRRAGAANVMRSAAGSLEGVALRVTAEGFKGLDRKEGYRRASPARSSYNRRLRKVYLANRETVHAWVYKANPKKTKRKPQKPLKSYVDLMVQGSKAHNLSAGHVAHLEAIETVEIERALRQTPPERNDKDSPPMKTLRLPTGSGAAKAAHTPVKPGDEAAAPAAAAIAPAAEGDSQPKEPVLIFAPYLPLREPVLAGSWWIGPLKRFEGVWRDDRFQALVRMFIGSFRDARGQPLDNPALIAHKDRGADGIWPGAAPLANLQLALDFAVLDANRPWEMDEVKRQGSLTATSDNARLVVWSIDTADASIALRDGVMVETIVGGLHIDEKLVMRALTELHIPHGVMVAPDLLVALLAVFSGERTVSDATLAKRLSIATTWLAQAWRNTDSIRPVERIVMLKTGFEALTNDSERSAGGRLDTLFAELLTEGVTDAVAEELLWRPSDKDDLTRTWVAGGQEKTVKCTPLNHWFQSFTDVRNAIIHEGSTSNMDYAGPAERYRGPYIFIAERLLRESIRVTLRQFGFPDLWKTYPMRLIAKALKDVPLEKLLKGAEKAEDASLPSVPNGLEARPVYLVERRRSAGWRAWTARHGSDRWHVVRFPEWPPNRSDAIIGDDATSLMRLTAMILADASGDDRSYDELYRGDFGNYQGMWHRFRDEHLLTIDRGQRGLLSPTQVLAWATAQPEYDAFLGGDDRG